MDRLHGLLCLFEDRLCVGGAALEGKRERGLNDGYLNDRLALEGRAAGNR
jgi:hypothetical protein